MRLQRVPLFRKRFWSVGENSLVVCIRGACDDRGMSEAATVPELLHEAAETHHIVYRLVDGDDPDWASWYADWLLGAAPSAAVSSPSSSLSTASTRPSPARSAGRTGTPTSSSSASAAAPSSRRRPSPPNGSAPRRRRVPRRAPARAARRRRRRRRLPPSPPR